MVRVNNGYELSYEYKYDKAKKKWVGGGHIQGRIPTMKEALAMAYQMVKSNKNIEIGKDIDSIKRDRYGDIEDIEPVGYSVGIVKEVKRKSGRAVTYTKYELHSQDNTYTADVTPDGRLVNKR